MQQVLAVALNVWLARLLGVADYGVYAFTISVVTLLGVISKFGLPTLALKDVASATVRKEGNDARSVVGQFLQLLCYLLLTVMASAWLFLGATGVVKNEEYKSAISVGLWLVATMSLSGLLAACLRGLSLRRVALAIGLEMLTPQVALLTGLTVIAILGTSVSSDIALAFRLGGGLVAVLILGVIVHRHLSKIPVHMDSRYANLFAVAQATFPLLLFDGASIVLARSDVVMLGLQRGSNEVGLYSVALQGTVVMNTVLATVNMLLSPEYARLNATGDTKSLQRIAVLSARGIFLASLLILATYFFLGEWAISLLFGPNYAPALEPLVILGLGSTVAALLGNPAALLNMTGHQVSAMQILLAAAALNVAMNLYLIPNHGMIGAAWATTICLVGWKAVAAIQVRRKLNLQTTAFDRIMPRSK